MNIKRIIAIYLILTINSLLFGKVLDVRPLPLQEEGKKLWYVYIETEQMSNSPEIEINIDDEWVSWEDITYKVAYNYNDNGYIKVKLYGNNKPEQMYKYVSGLLDEVIDLKSFKGSYEIVEKKDKGVSFGNSKFEGTEAIYTAGPWITYLGNVNINLGIDYSSSYQEKNRYNFDGIKSFSDKFEIVSGEFDSSLVYLGKYNKNKWIELSMYPVQVWNNDVFETEYYDIGEDISNWRNEGTEFARRVWLGMNTIDSLLVCDYSDSTPKFDGVWYFNEVIFGENSVKESIMDNENAENLQSVVKLQNTIVEMTKSVPSFWEITQVDETSYLYNTTLVISDELDENITAYRIINCKDCDMLENLSTVNLQTKDGNIYKFNPDELPAIISL